MQRAIFFSPSVILFMFGFWGWVFGLGFFGVGPSRWFGNKNGAGKTFCVVGTLCKFWWLGDIQSTMHKWVNTIVVDFTMHGIVLYHTFFLHFRSCHLPCISH